MALPAPDPALGDPASWPALALGESYERLEQFAEDGRRKHVLDDLPDSEQSARVDEYESRARVIGERLWMLGYFDGHKSKAKNVFANDRASFHRAVERFQTDARLDTDGWVGKETWTALEELVSFEGEPVSDRWFDLAEPAPAFLRAAQLRLSVLGLGARRPGTTFESLSAASMDKFHRILFSLELIDSIPEHTTEESLRLLLDLDTLVDRVAAISVPHPDRRRKQLVFRYVKKRSWSDAGHRKLMSGVLVQLAKIELWLLGFEDIDLRPTMSYPVLNFDETKTADRDMRGALIEFHTRLLGLDESNARSRSRRITPEFFRAVRLQEGAPATEQLDDWDRNDAEALADRFEAADDAEAALETGRSMGLRIWDGLKRVFNWFRKRVRRIIELGKNLVRAFYRYATKGLQILRRAVRAFVESIQTYIAGHWDHPDSTWPIVLVKKDIDSTVFCHADNTDAGITAAGHRMRLFSARVRFSAEILGLVFRAVVSAGPLRWATLARALVRRLRRLMPLYRQIQALESALAAGAAVITTTG